MRFLLFSEFFLFIPPPMPPPAPGGNGEGAGEKPPPPNPNIPLVLEPFWKRPKEATHQLTTASFKELLINQKIYLSKNPNLVKNWRTSSLKTTSRASIWRKRQTKKVKKNSFTCQVTQHQEHILMMAATYLRNTNHMPTPADIITLSYVHPKHDSLTWHTHANMCKLTHCPLFHIHYICSHISDSPLTAWADIPKHTWACSCACMDAHLHYILHAPNRLQRVAYHSSYIAFNMKFTLQKPCRFILSLTEVHENSIQIVMECTNPKIHKGYL